MDANQMNPEVANPVVDAPIINPTEPIVDAPKADAPVTIAEPVVIPQTDAPVSVAPASETVEAPAPAAPTADVPVVGADAAVPTDAPAVPAAAAAAATEPEPTGDATAESSSNPTPSKKRAADDAPVGGPDAKKPRITRATINKFLKKGKLLESKYFKWSEWSDVDNGEFGDATYKGCTMKVDIVDKDNNVVIAKGKRCHHIEWYTSKSMIIFYPTKSISSAVVCPLEVVAGTPLN